MHSPSLTAQPQLNRPGASIKPQAAAESPWPFRFVLLSLVFEFGRPQEIIPGLKFIPFSSLLNAAILASLIMSGKVSLKDLRTKLWIPLLGVMLLHVPIANNTFHAVMTLKDMSLLFCLYLGLIAYVDTFDRLFKLVSVWLGVHVIAAILGIASGGTGVGGWLGDENDFCMTINMALPFAFFMIYANAGFQDKLRYVGMMTLFVFTVLITLSRGGFFGMVSAGFYCWLKSPRKMVAIVLVMVLSIFVLVAAPAQFWEEIGSSFSEETMEVGTGGDRLYIWGIGFEMFLANPILGVGQGNFPWTFEEYEAGRTFLTASRAGRAAHSLYFTLLPEMGLLGLSVFVLMNWHNFLTIRKVERLAEARAAEWVKGDPTVSADVLRKIVLIARSMEGSMIGFLVSSIFISTIWYPSFWVMTGFIVALQNVVTAQAEKAGLQVGLRPRPDTSLKLRGLTAKPAFSPGIRKSSR